MPYSPSEINERITRIHAHADPKSARYGRLVNWKDPFWKDLVWHYGIGLSDTHIFDTGQELCCFGSSHHGAKHVLGVNDLHYAPGAVVERLCWALQVFGGWDYGFLGWNCEHLARLVATGEAKSYGVKEKLIFGDQWHHKEAEHKFMGFLNKQAPHLLDRESV